MPLGMKLTIKPPAPVRDTPGAADRADSASTLLSPDEVATKLGVSPKLLERWRSTGEGPAFARLSRKTIRYRGPDVADFVAGRMRTNTADQG
jgi:hypothetical protein